MEGENQQARAIQDEFAALYRDTFAQIYQKITMQNQVISPSGNYYAPVNTEDIAGIYYGKEDPMFDIRVGNEQGFDTLDLSHRHSSKNHNTLDFDYTIGVDENHNRAYTDFAGLHDVNQPYGKLLYDITYMLIYSVYLGNMPALSAFLSY